MNKQITAVVEDDHKILLDGRELNGIDDVANALGAELEKDPNFTLVIASSPTEYYRGIGTLIYASQRAGVPVENLRWTMDDGAVVTFEELKARNAAPPA